MIAQYLGTCVYMQSSYTSIGIPEEQPRAIVRSAPNSKARLAPIQTMQIHMSASDDVKPDRCARPGTETHTVQRNFVPCDGNWKMLVIFFFSSSGERCIAKKY